MATRDEFTDRPWRAPAGWWPRYPGVLGGKDQQAGGSWLAVNEAHGSVAMVLNGRSVDHVHVAETAPTRGMLPLKAAGKLELPTPSEVRGMAPFHLLLAGPSGAWLASWARGRYRVRDLPAGLSLVTSRGANQAGDPLVDRWLAPFRTCRRPDPELGAPADSVWQRWLSVLDEGAGEAGTDRSSVLKRPPATGGRVWATVSLSAFAAGGDGVRYDFASLSQNRSAGSARWSRII